MKNKIDEQIIECIPLIKRYAHKLTHSKDSSDDLVQDTILRAYEKINMFQCETNLKAWLFTICRNIFINNYKMYNRYKHLKISEDPEDENEIQLKDNVDEPETPSDEYIIALRNIPTEISTVIILCDIEQYSYKEASYYLDIPVGTVRSRLYRGRRLINKSINKQLRLKG